MENNILYILIIILSFAILWLYRTKNDIQFFMELNQNISFVTTTSEIITINQAGLDFFECDTVNAFLKKEKHLDKLFEEVKINDKRVVHGKEWVTYISNKENIKVEMYKGNLKQVFYMQVSQIEAEKYLVVFYNISQIIAEKEAISKVAENDELTNVYNRSKFNNSLPLALKNKKMHNRTFSIILLDIDYFKNINDEHGHNIGDQILVQFSALIKAQLRSNDTFARWGGEEFIILSDDTIEKNAYLMANRLRSIVETFHFTNDIRLTCSLGITEVKENDTFESIIQRVDMALYKSKNNGRNMVSM